MKYIKTFESFLNENYNLNGLCYNELGECMPKLSQSDLTAFCKEFVPQVNRPFGPLSKDIQDYLTKNKIECSCSMEKVIGLLSGRTEYISESLDEAVSVDASKYVRAHGKKPKGNGMWGFEIKGQEVFTPTAMDYAAAQKWAKEEGKKLNAITVYTLG